MNIYSSPHGHGNSLTVGCVELTLRWIILRILEFKMRNLISIIFLQ